MILNDGLLLVEGGVGLLDNLKEKEGGRERQREGGTEGTVRKMKVYIISK